MPEIRKEAFLSRELDGELLLYHPPSDTVHALNPTARLIFEACDGVRSADRIVAHVADRCGLRPEAVRPEVKRTLRELARIAGQKAPSRPPVTDGGRRAFVATAIKGAALLPWVVPAIQSLALQDAAAQAPSVPGPPPTDPPPTVDSCSPDNADPGDTVVVTVRGSDFTATPAVDFGPGITVNSVTYQNQGRLYVGITVQSGATPGYRNVTVTNPDTQSDSLTDGFLVNYPPVAPTVTSCTPNNANKDTTLNVTVGGSDFQATPTVSFSNNKIDVNSVTFVSSTTLIVNITIRFNAKSGACDITVTNPGGLSGTLSNGFTVN